MYTYQQVDKTKEGGKETKHNLSPISAQIAFLTESQTSLLYGVKKTFIALLAYHWSKKNKFKTLHTHELVPKKYIYLPLKRLRNILKIQNQIKT